MTASASCNRNRPGPCSPLPVDAIDEFRVETNSYSAEYGRSNGGGPGQSKSGTNDLHGTLFEFFRNEKLNARNFFATTGDKPRFRRNRVTGSYSGGPIQKNQTFFFIDWQGTRLNTGVVRTSTVPTPSQKRGIFSTPIFDPATTRRIDNGYSRDPFPGNMIPPRALSCGADASRAISRSYRCRERKQLQAHRK